VATEDSVEEDRSGTGGDAQVARSKQNSLYPLVRLSDDRRAQFIRECLQVSIWERTSPGECCRQRRKTAALPLRYPPATGTSSTRATRLPPPVESLFRHSAPGCPKWARTILAIAARCRRQG
jgi:hypothetical protein